MSTLEREQRAPVHEDWRAATKLVARLRHRPVRGLSVALFVATAVALNGLAARPLYRTSAKVRVEDFATKNPQLAEQRIPPGIATADEAQSHLRSRALIARFAAPRATDAALFPDPRDPAAPLGLTTWVTDETAPPLVAALHGARDKRASYMQVAAAIEQRAPGAPQALRVWFRDASTIAVAAADAEASATLHTVDPLLLHSDLGARIEHAGVTLRIAVRGALDSRPWRIEALDIDRVIDRVMAGVRVDALQHQQGTFGVTVTDEDPQRAAAIANAMVHGLVRLDVDRTRTRALDAAAYLRRELDAQRTALAEREAAISSLTITTPELVDRDTARRALSARSSALTLQRAELERSRAQISAVLDELAAGRKSGLARSAAALDDPSIKRILADLGAHEGELLRVERTDQGEYRRTLRVTADRYRAEADSTSERFNQLSFVLQRIEERDLDALALLGGDLTTGGIALTATLQSWTQELEQDRLKLKQMERDYTDSYEPLQAARTRFEARIRRLEAGLRTQLAAQSALLEQRRADARRWEELVAAEPLRESQLVQSAIEQLLRELHEALTARLAGFVHESEAIERELEEVRERQRALRTAEEALIVPQLERDQLQAAVAAMLRDVSRAEVAAAGVTPGVSVLDAALVPRQRSKPITSFVWIVGGAVGAGVGAAVQLLAGRRRGRDVDDEELARETELPLLARVPASVHPAVRHDGQRAHMALLDEPGGAAAHALRGLRGRLLAADGTGRVPRAVAVLPSDARGSGTELAIGLALARAQTGARVCLIEGDLRRPRLCALLGMDEAPGLAEALDGRKHWRQCVRTTEVPGLVVLPAGRPFDDPADLIESPSFRRFAEDIAAHHDLVVYDLPAPTAAVEVEVAVRQLDGAIVVHADDTEYDEGGLRTTIARLRGVGARLLGVVRTESGAGRAHPIRKWRR